MRGLVIGTVLAGGGILGKAFDALKHVGMGAHQLHQLIPKTKLDITRAKKLKLRVIKSSAPIQIKLD
jgi:hypothetical protein